MQFAVFERRGSTMREFIEFWSKQYFDEHEDRYIRNIGKPITAVTIRELFYWKNSGPLSILKTKSIDTKFISKLPILAKLPKDHDVRSFFELFSDGGPIWRIFFLHIWQPNKYPIYDQHVHRSMCFLVHGRKVEIPQRTCEVIDSYVESYLPFHTQFRKLQDREVDKALWMFGRFLKSPFFETFSGQDTAIDK
jgi:hypothetical protein